MIKVSPKEIWEILKDIKNIKWANGFFMGFWLFSILLLTSSYLSFEPTIKLPKREALFTENQPLELSSEKILNGKYLIVVGTIDLSDCITDFSITRPNGQITTSTYCLNDEIVIENWIYKVIDIKKGTSSPIKVKIYRIIHIRWVLWLLVFALPLILLKVIHSNISTDKEVKEKVEREQKIEKLFKDKQFKKYKVTEKDFKEYIKDQYP